MPQLIVPVSRASGGAALANTTSTAPFLVEATGDLLILPKGSTPSQLTSWSVFSIYGPGWVAAIYPGVAPTTATLTVTAMLSGSVVWSTTQTLPLEGAGSGFGLYAVSQYVAAADLFNPIVIQQGQALTFNAAVSFDQDVTQWFVGLAQAIDMFTPALTAIAAPATITYNTQPSNDRAAKFLAR